MMRKIFFGQGMLAILLCLCIACTSQSGNRMEVGGARTAADSVRFARGFRIATFDDYTIVSVVNPWNKNKLLKRYVLVPKNRALPANLPDGIIVRTPLARTVSFGSVQCSFFAEIGVQETLVGVCEPHFINLPFIKENVANGRIADVGAAANPNLERLIMLEPEALFTAPIDEAAAGKSAIVGAVAVEGLDYMESTPLGRAEWIRFYALFFDKRATADSLFAQTVVNYRVLQAQTENLQVRPTVFAETVYSGVWWMPGGNSYMAHLYHDAGADYLWKDDTRTGSIGPSFETVLDKAETADCWLIKYNSLYPLTKSRLKAENPNYALFDAFKKGNIFAVNTAKTLYYETLAVHPDIILRDLAKIFNPKIFNDAAGEYYHRIEE